jgi:hypothetical protein
MAQSSAKYHFLILICLLSGGATINAQNWVSMPGTEDGRSEIKHSMVLNNELYVTGIFDSTGGVYTKGFAKWNGSKWDSVCPRTGRDWDDIWTIGQYKGDLYAMFRPDNSNGYYAEIKKWDGRKWETIGTTNASWGKIPNSMIVTGPNIRMVKEYKGELYVAGNFSSMNGVVANNIARWDGKAWKPLSAGLDFEDMLGIDGMCEYKGKLYIAGWFNKADGKPANNIACWDGTKWIAVPKQGSNHFEALAEYKGELYAGGTFENDSGKFVTGIKRWNGEKWNDVGTGVMGMVTTLAVYNNELYASWSRMSIEDTCFAIGRWNGKTWAKVGAGINNPHVIDSLGLSKRDYIETRAVYSTVIYKNELYIAGLFFTAGNIPAKAIAKWSVIHNK